MQNYNGQGSCKNPHRGGPDSPTDFFRPCYGSGRAYTFPNDSNTNQLNGKCPSERYTGCVGTACRSGPA